MNQNNSTNKSEVNLIDIFHVIWRWKIFICIVAVVTTITVSIYAFSMTKIYECNIVVTPTTFNRGLGEKPVSIISSSDIVAAVKLKVLQKNIISTLDLSGKQLQEDDLIFRVTSPKKTNKIHINNLSSSPELGRKILRSLIDSLEKYFQPVHDRFKDEKQGELSVIEFGIETYRNKIDRALKAKDEQEKIISVQMGHINKMKLSLEEEMKNIENGIKETRAEIAGAQHQYKELDETRKAKNGRELRTVVNSQMLIESKLMRLQMFEKELHSLYGMQRNQLSDCFFKYYNLINQKNAGQDNFENEKLTLDLLIKKLEHKKRKDLVYTISSVVEIASPVRCSPKPVRPQIGLMLFVAFASSLFVSVFLVFIIDYFKKRL